MIPQSIPNILYIKLKLRISSKWYNNPFISKIKIVDCESNSVKLLFSLFLNWLLPTLLTWVLCVVCLVFPTLFKIIPQSILNILFIKLKLWISSKRSNNPFLSQIKIVDCESNSVKLTFFFFFKLTSSHTTHMGTLCGVPGISYPF